MVTVKADGKETQCYQYCDLETGDFFMLNGDVLVKTTAAIDEYGHVTDAVNVRRGCMSYVPEEYIVEPINMEFEEVGEEDVQD